MSADTESHDEAIKQFCGVTGADEERAMGLLEACDWNLELAINMHVDTDDGRGNANRPTSFSTNSAAGPSTSMSNSTSNNSPDVITLPDVDEEEEDLNRRPARMQNHQRLSTASRINEPGPPMSTNALHLEDDVRPPIMPIRQVLVQHPAEFVSDIPQRRYNTRTGGMSDVYDAFRDFQAEAQWQEMAQHEGVASASTDSPASIANKRRTLQELFRPPLEIMFRGNFASARESGTSQNKWLLVNIQNGREFKCQTLNRDVWSNQTVKDILKEHFIFWQVYHDSFEGGRYIQFYKVTSYPHVSIIDPRTGEQMRSWPTSIDHNSFCDSVIEFLTEHPSPDGSSDANTMKKLRVKEEDVARTLYDQSEEAQLEAAIKASLQDTETSSSSKAFLDEDSYIDAIESDTDQEQTQSSFHVQTSSSSSSTLGKIKNENRASNGQSSSSGTGSGNVANTSKLGPKSEFCIENSSNKKSVLSDSKEKSRSSIKKEIEDYKKYLGSDKEKFSDLVVRFPDGSRDQFKFPSDSLMKALFLLLSSRGYGINEYNYVTNFPRRLLHELPSTDTLLDAKLIRETIFVERRISE